MLDLCYRCGAVVESTGQVIYCCMCVGRATVADVLCCGLTVRDLGRSHFTHWCFS